MAYTVPSVTALGEQSAGAPQLTAAQRAVFQFGFLLNATTGRYEIVNGLVAGTKDYFQRSAASGRLTLNVLQGGSVRLIRLANGRITTP